MLRYYLIILLLCGGLWGYPLDRWLNRGVLDNWATEDGLPQNSVSTIVEDPEGYLWLGTEEGLVRFDGSHFKIFDQSFFSDIHNLYVNGIILKGRQLWVLFQDHGVVQLDLDQMHYRRITIPGTGEITSMISGDGDTVWLAGTGKLCRIHAEKQHCIKTPKSYIGSLQRSPSGEIWFLHRDHISYRYNGKKIEPGVTLKPGTVLISHLIDRDGGVWMGTRNSGAYYHKDGETIQINPEQLKNNMIINRIFQDQNGAIWLSILDRGIYRLGSDRKLVPGGFLKVPFVIHFTEDRWGNIWMGSKSGGLFRLHPGAFVTYTPGKQHRKWMGLSIYETTDGTIFLGSHQKGIYRLKGNRLERVLKEDQTPIKGTVTSITGDGAGGIYAGFYKLGIQQVTSDGAVKPVSIFSIKTIPSVLHYSKDGALWIGTFNYGVYNIKNNILTHLTEREPEIRSVSTIFEDEDGGIWFGGQQGIYLYKDGVYQKRYSEIKGKVFSIKRYQGRFYAATSSGFWIDYHGVIKRISTRNGLPVDKIFDFQFDQSGRVWLSSNKGIFSINHKSLDQFLTGGSGLNIIRYDQADGLYSTEGTGGTQHNVYRTKDGDIWFAMLRGISRVNPEALKEEGEPAGIKVPEIILDGKKHIVREGKLTIPPMVKKIEFHYHGSTYHFPKKVRFRYQLKGVDDHWIEGNQQVIYYNTLPPGQYLFKLQATNSRGEWRGNHYELTLRVQAAFYQTIWFYIIVIVASLLILLLFVKWRLYLVKKENLKLERLVQERTREIQEHLKRIEELSLKDPLTGLLNRRFVSDILKPQINAFVNQCKHLLFNEQERERSSKGVVYGVYLFDIDHFKQVNDTYGHDAGDLVLKQFATILRNSVREDDIVIRWGGEEFLVILKETSLDYLQRFAVSIKEKVSSHSFDTGIDGRTIQKNCSIGYVKFPFITDYPDWLTLEQVIRLADLGLYHSKHNGRNMAVHVQESGKIPDRREYYHEILKLEQSLEDGYLQIEID